jgi:hypothetical protein
MNTSMANGSRLSQMLSSVLQDQEEKLAAAPPESFPFGKKKEEKKDSKKEKEEDKGKSKEEKEKVSSGIDYDEIDMLAAALDFASEKLASDGVERGGEPALGAMQLANNKPLATAQVKKDNKPLPKHEIPKTTPGEKPSGAKGTAATAVQTNEAKQPGGAAYPAKGVLKTGAAKSVHDMIAAAGGTVDLDKTEEQPAKTDGEKAAEEMLSKLSKDADVTSGAMRLDSKSGEGPKPPTGAGGGNSARSHIESNQAAINMTKREAKAPQKRMLAAVLTEPAQSVAHDSKVQDNLRNANSAGVKIAASKALLAKIAEEGCKCDGKGKCQYCKVMAAKKKIDEKNS